MDKLTHNLTVKISPDRLPRLQAIASHRGMELSEYVRHLIDSDEAALSAEWKSLGSIFDASAVADKGYISRLGTTGGRNE